MPNSNPHSDLLTNQLNCPQFYSTLMRISPWLRFSTVQEGDADPDNQRPPRPRRHVLGLLERCQALASPPARIGAEKAGPPGIVNIL